jgi:molybdopterin molybdotransferase
MAIRIFTGAPVPEGADCIVPREQCDELGDRVRVRVPNDDVLLGQHIRHRGENALQGFRCLSAGTVIDGPRAATWTSFSETAIAELFEPVRVAVLNTGDELTEVGEPICDWQIRDSNGPLLESMMHPIRWIHARREKVRDDAATVRANLKSALEGADAVLLTGGVSMGDTDHVPEAVAACGGRIVFHRIPIRPGKPLLGAVGPAGQLILGLPGNPVSVAVTFRRYAWPLLRYLAGIEPSTEPKRWVSLECDDRKTLDLLWFRLAMLDARGQVSLVPNQGSGDVAALGQSHGFVEIPPGAPTRGAVAFYDWRCPS